MGNGTATCSFERGLELLQAEAERDALAARVAVLERGLRAAWVVVDALRQVTDVTGSTEPAHAGCTDGEKAAGGRQTEPAR